MTTFTGQHLPRRGTAATWASDNPVLGEGERGWESDTNRSKLGDGTTEWNDLDYDYGHGRTVLASEVSFTPTGTIAASNVQAAIAEVASEGGGGGGAVDSVNGQTGTVVLDAADVSADTAGSAAAVQDNLDAHEATLGLGAHVPTGGTEGQVLTKGSGASVAWGAAAGGAVSSVNGETGAVTLTAADVGFTPTGSIAGDDVQEAIAEVASDASTALNTHTGSTGPGTHLASGGTSGQVPVNNGSGASPWATLTAAQVSFSPTGTIAASTAQAAIAEVATEAAAAQATLLTQLVGVLPIVMLWNDADDEYITPLGLTALGLTPADFGTRFWVGPVAPGLATGGDDYVEGDPYIDLAVS